MFWKPKLQGTGYSCSLLLFLSLSNLLRGTMRQVVKPTSSSTVLSTVGSQPPLPTQGSQRPLSWSERKGLVPAHRWQTQLRLPQDLVLVLTLLLQYCLKTQYWPARTSNRLNSLSCCRTAGCSVTQGSAWRNFRKPKGLNHCCLPKRSWGHKEHLQFQVTPLTCNMHYVMRSFIEHDH